MRRWSVKLIAILIAFFVIAYLVDWILLQVRERNGSAYGTVVVENADVIKEKGNKVEYFFNTPQPTPCVHALFPHEGQPACWWLTRHSEQQRFMN